MQLMCPVSSIAAAKMFAKIGVGEIYVGVDCNDLGLNNVTFTGRTRVLCSGESVQLSDFSELKEVVDICHSKNIKVNFTANVRNLPEALIDEYIQYVEKGIHAGVDAVIVGSIVALIALKDRYDIQLHSSTFFYPFNKYNVDFFHFFDIKRIILPTALSLVEIKQIVDYIAEKNYDMEVEVFGHFGCSNINGRCNIFNNPPSICRGQFQVYDKSKNNIKSSVNIIDAGKDCTICSLKELNDIGITSLKIMGRGLSLQLVGTLASLYQEALYHLSNGMETSEIRSKLLERANWWENSYCNDNRCMYLDTETSKYYV